MDSTAIAARPADEPRQCKHSRAAPWKVFISYAREDQDFALQLKRDLEAEGVVVWMDVNIKPGNSWVKNIEEAIEACTDVLLILSPASRVSDYVESELILAKDQGKGIIPLRCHNTARWLISASAQEIDFTALYDEGFAKLMDREPPPRTFWRRILVALNTIWAFRPYLVLLAVGIAVTAYAYFFSPSDTSFSISRGDKSGITVRVRNRGGKPSILMGNSFKLHFGRLPIETETMVLLQPEKHSRIAGHGDVDLRLTADNMLTPKSNGENSYYTQDDIVPLLSDAKLTLTAQVKESDDRFHTRSEEFVVERIKAFVLEEFPDDVP